MRIKVFLAKLLKHSQSYETRYSETCLTRTPKKPHGPKGSGYNEFGYYDHRAACFALKSLRLMLSSVTVTSFYYICLFFVSGTQCK